jgi:hypothetical protein
VFGGGAVVEAEGAGDDRRRGLEHELAERCCPCLGERDAEFVELSAEPDGHKGWPTRWPGNSHWQPGLAAVVIQSQAGQSAYRLGVEQQEAPCDPGTQFDALVGQKPVDQGEAPVLADRRPLGVPSGRDVEAGHGAAGGSSLRALGGRPSLVTAQAGCAP